MIESDESPAYSHTQTAPLCLFLDVAAAGCLALAWAIGEMPGVIIAGTTGVALALIAPAFHHLKVEDRGEELAIRFGPVPLCRKTVLYADIEEVEVGRTLILDGWGIHLSIRGGWVWNIWGRDCVVVRMRRGSVLRIGTDDAENLALFLKAKINGQPSPP